ncbi:MAG: hypothetical protein J6Y19_05510 [Kiritimatiellae bacterium]|nr:hypothetical protein [Kiritimatiellia bacterium]
MSAKVKHFTGASASLFSFWGRWGTVARGRESNKVPDYWLCGTAECDSTGGVKVVCGRDGTRPFQGGKMCEFT